MKIAIATKDFATVSSHAGQTRQWLLYDLSEHRAHQLLPVPLRVDLDKEQVLHVFEDNAPHPLDGVDIVVAASTAQIKLAPFLGIEIQHQLPLQDTCRQPSGAAHAGFFIHGK